MRIYRKRRNAIIGLLSLCFMLTACTSLPQGNTGANAIQDSHEEYGLLYGYDTQSRELQYTPIEIVEESDTARISELEAQGITPEFPNGYLVYQSNEIQLCFPVAESVSVSLLNDEFTLETSTMDAVSDRLEGHPPFFPCRLQIADGVIQNITEYFVP